MDEEVGITLFQGPFSYNPCVAVKVELEEEEEAAAAAGKWL